ncbi:MAG: hypothetical protein IT376_22170 [Polyangiaceae bacterium]|nr:hypothetical protein [Polyangiaceae bacterium]
MHARLLRVPIASAGMVATLAAIAWAHHREYPAQHWLAWRYAAYLGAATLWLAGCAGTGARLVRALLARHVPALELGSLGLAAGLFTFQLTTFALGLLGALHWAALVAVSVAMLVVGRSELRRAAVTVRRVARRPPAPRSLGALGALALGLGGLGLVYFAALAPESVSFDARWRHLVLAESYAAARHIGRYPEGWVFAASPHFSSLTFVPAFALPGLALFDRMALAVHFEWVVFAATTVLGVAALARRLAPRAPASVWAVRLLFPGVLVYDATVSGGIDHLGATYAPAAVLAMLDCLRPAPRSPGAPGYPPPPPTIAARRAGRGGGPGSCSARSSGEPRARRRRR